MYLTRKLIFALFLLGLLERQHNLGLQCPPTLDTPRQQLYCRPARRPDLFGCEDTNNTICVTDDNCEQCQVCCPSPRPRFSMEDGNRTGHCIRRTYHRVYPSPTNSQGLRIRTWERYGSSFSANYIYIFYTIC